MPPVDERGPEVPAEDAQTCSFCSLRPVTEEVEDARLCLPCRSELTFECRDCEVRRFLDDSYYIQDVDRRVCESCFVDGDYTECVECGEYVTTGETSVILGERVCRRCAEEDDDDDEPLDAYRNTEQPNLSTTNYVSEQPGTMIKSKRHFGVELECVYNSYDSTSKVYENFKDWGFSSDGSVRRHKNAVGTSELVSPVLGGEKGEKQIIDFCKAVNENGFAVNKSCGFHLHLEALDFKRDPKKDKKQKIDTLPSEQIEYYWTSKDPYSSFPVQLSSVRLSDLPRDIIESGKYKTKVRKLDNTLPINKGESFYRLRDLFFTYLAFDDVFRGMQPPSRRRNTFCHSTSSRYSLEDVRNLEDFNELESMWYKIDRRIKVDAQYREAMSRKGSPKDGSRYVGFNLAPILSTRGKTIELRYHSPTLNAEKILRWVDIHQTIFDRVATGEFPEDEIEDVIATETTVFGKAKRLCEIFGIQKETEEYMMARLEKFNSKDEKKNEIDEEVEDSEVGRPSHSNRTRRMTRPARQSPSFVSMPDVAFNPDVAFGIANLRRRVQDGVEVTDQEVQAVIRNLNNNQ